MDEEYGRSTIDLAQVIQAYAALDLYSPDRVKVRVPPHNTGVHTIEIASPGWGSCPGKLPLPLLVHVLPGFYRTARLRILSKCIALRGDAALYEWWRLSLATPISIIAVLAYLAGYNIFPHLHFPPTVSLAAPSPNAF